MSKSSKIFLSDALINTFAQTVVLFAGIICAAVSGFALLGWLALIVGYSFVLAKMARDAEKKCADFRRWALWVMLTPNLIAAAVSVCLFLVGASSPAKASNAVFGAIVLVGSAVITLLALVIKRAFRA